MLVEFSARVVSRQWPHADDFCLQNSEVHPTRSHIAKLKHESDPDWCFMQSATKDNVISTLSDNLTMLAHSRWHNSSQHMLVAQLQLVPRALAKFGTLAKHNVMSISL